MENTITRPIVVFQIFISFVIQAGEELASTIRESNILAKEKTKVKQNMFQEHSGLLMKL